MTQAISRWIPSAGVVTHAGEPIPGNSVFFTAPPPEIGEVYSAQSGWIGDKRAGSGPKSVFMIGLLAIVGIVIVGFVTFLFSHGSPVITSIGALLGGTGFGYLMYKSELEKNAVTYTGTKGIARYVYSPEVDKRERGTVFLFENAVELRTSQTRNYTNGAYTGTTYSYNWTGKDRKQVFFLGGSYTNEKGLPRSDHPFHYARAAEVAWSKHLLKFVNEELNRSGAFRFNLKGENCVVAGPGFLDLYMGGKQTRCMVNEIAKVEINQGMVTVRRKDAKDGFMGIGSAGTFKFAYSDLANGRVFMMLLDQLVGIS